MPRFRRIRSIQIFRQRQAHDKTFGVRVHAKKHVTMSDVVAEFTNWLKAIKKVLEGFLRLRGKIVFADLALNTFEAILKALLFAFQKLLRWQMFFQKVENEVVQRSKVN